ncbi:DEKNAAC100928 [Brettanomyces naardenensis]|uniref:DEKNAAC100929 n=1 Tax=Brettanomyces naardenensis TaxID=13370 RepID=A0A448YGZ6_BRENA|nr:DEKNAAC100928 [Brettanomyces naardenensis]
MSLFYSCAFFQLSIEWRSLNSSGEYIRFGSVRSSIMKFGKTFLLHQVPEWQKCYLNYKSLKRQIKVIYNREIQLLAKDPSANVLNDPSVKASLASFFFDLDRNIEKVDDFYNKRYAEYERRLKRITSSLPSSKSSSLPISFDDDEEREEIIGVLLELRNCFRNLKWYGELNKRAFGKILKKLDKKTGTHRQESYLAARVYPLDFCNEQDSIRCLVTINEYLTRMNKPENGTVSESTDVLAVPSSPSASSLSSVSDVSVSSSLPPPSSVFVATTNGNNGKLDSSSPTDPYSDAIKSNDKDALDKALIKECLSPVLAPLRLLLSLLNRATLCLSRDCIDYLLEIIPVLSDSSDISGRNFIHHHVIALGKQYVKDLEQKNSVSIPVPSQSPSEFSYRLLSTFGPDGANSNDFSQGLLYIFEHLPPHLKFAILQKDNYKRTPLHYAAQYGLKEVARIILQFMKQWTLYDETVSLDDPVRWGDYENLTPLHLAVLGSHSRTTEVLIDAMDRDKVTLSSPELLHIATRLDCPKIIELLIRCKGVDIDYCERETNETALYIASKLNLVSSVEFILSKNANTEIAEATFGWTPVFVAAAEGFLEIETLLLKHGARYDFFDNSGWTPREHAALRGHMNLVPLLTPPDYDPYSLLDSSSISPKVSPKMSPYNMKELANSIDRLTDYNKESDNHHDSVVRQLREKRANVQRNSSPPIESYGHKSLKPNQALVLVTLGTTDIRDTEVSLDLRKVPISKLHSTELDSALSLSIHTADPRQPAVVVDLPLDDTHGSATDPITFKCEEGTNPLDTIIYFDIVPTYQYGPDSYSKTQRVLGRAVAILRNVYTSVGELKKSLVNSAKIPILESSTLEVLGTVKFEIMLVTSFQHPNMTSSHSGVYWKSLVTPRVIGHRGMGMNSPGRKSLQLGENTMEAFIAAASLGASYVEFDVQLTKDNVPVVYHDFLVAESGIDVPMHALTLEQFLGLSQNNRHKSKKSVDDSFILKSSYHRGEEKPDTSSSEERMRHTKTWKLKQYKGNSRGSSIASSFVTLAELFKKVPSTVGFNIEVKYPMLDESQMEDMGQVGPDMNHFVDTILSTVFANKGGRDVVFSSFHPDICTMLSLKQPSIPILFLTDSGCSPVADIRSCSLQNAIRFARKWNLLGIVTNATPIVECPRLASVVKASGLVCVTYGSENNEPANAKLEMAADVDAVIVDSVLAVRKELTKAEKERNKEK